MANSLEVRVPFLDIFSRIRGASESMPDNAPILDPDRELEPQDPFAVVDHWLARYDRVDGAPPLEKFVYTGSQTSLAGTCSSRPTIRRHDPSRASDARAGGSGRCHATRARSYCLRRSDASPSGALRCPWRPGFAEMSRTMRKRCWSPTRLNLGSVIWVLLMSELWCQETLDSW